MGNDTVDFCFSDAPQHSTGAKQKEVKQSPHPLGDISIVELPPVPDYSNMKIDEKDCVYMGNVGDTINELGWFLSDEVCSIR